MATFGQVLGKLGYFLSHCSPMTIQRVVRWSWCNSSSSFSFSYPISSGNWCRFLMFHFPFVLEQQKNLIIIIDWHGNLILYFHKPFIFCDAEGKSFSELKNSQMDKQHFSKWKNRLSYVLGLVETIWKKYFYCAKSYDIT